MSTRPRWTFDTLVEAWHEVQSIDRASVAQLARRLDVSPAEVLCAHTDARPFGSDERVAVVATLRALVRARQPSEPLRALAALRDAIVRAHDEIDGFAPAFARVAETLLAERPPLGTLRGRARLMEELRCDLLREPRLPFPESFDELLDESTDVAPASPPLRGLEAPRAPSPSRDDVIHALREVHDPELGVDVVSLGLVYDARVEAGHAKVTMTLTSAACPLGDLIRRDAEWRIRGVPGIASASVTFVFDPPWTPAKMSAGARALIGGK